MAALAATSRSASLPSLPSSPASTLRLRGSLDGPGSLQSLGSSILRTQSSRAQGKYVPRCALEGPVPDRFKDWHKQERQRRIRLKSEHLTGRDFHGTAGDAAGFRAFLNHRSGSAARAWRADFAPDDQGVRPVTFSEFCMGIRRTGYDGNAMSLWRALTGDQRATATLADLEPRLARDLDALAQALGDAFPGGAMEAWPRLRRAHAGRANLDEFATFLMEEVLPEEVRIDVLRAFHALDTAGRGTITVGDLRFLDFWAQQRLGRPAPEELRVERQEREPWSPPPPAEVEPPGLNDLLEHLLGRCGSLARAWRMYFDVKGTGMVSPADFGKSCRAAGWLHPHGTAWRELWAASGGQGPVTLRELDPDTAQALGALYDALELKGFHGIYQLWRNLLDPNEHGTVSRVEFVNELVSGLGVDAEAAELIFAALDLNHLGWIAITELGFLERFQGNRRVESAAGNSAPTEAGRAAKAAEAQEGTLLSALETGSPGRSPPTLLDRELASPSERLGLGPRLRPKPKQRPHLSVVARSTRCMQRRVFNNTHQIKHRYFASAAMDRLRDHAAGQPKTERPKPSHMGDIFRATNEFYREGQRVLEEEDYGEDDDQELDGD